MRRSLCALVIACAVAVGVPTQADVITIYSDNATYVRADSPDTSYGSDASLFAGVDTSIRRSFIGFDTMGYQGVYRAQLQVYTLTSASSDATYDVFRTGDDTWNESLVTWNDQPATAGGAVGSYVRASGTSSGWVTIDVSGGFENSSNLGFVIVARDEGEASEYWPTYSDDHSQTFTPRLEVTTPEPGTLVLLGLGLAGLVARRRRSG